MCLIISNMMCLATTTKCETFRTLMSEDRSWLVTIIDNYNVVDCTSNHILILLLL